jgi:hypothetical protein
MARPFDQHALVWLDRFRVTSIETSWLSQSQRTFLPVSSRPPPLLNQNLEVIAVT